MRTTDTAEAKKPGWGLAKVLILIVPASVLPDVFSKHPHLVFGVGMIGGYLIQYFIPPRGRYFIPLLLLTVLAVIMNIVFVK